MVLFTQGKTNWKYILIVFILAVIIGGGILAYRYGWFPKGEVKISKPKPLEVETPKELSPEEIPKEETANWKTYRNEKYGYEIKYPEKWYITEASKEEVVFHDYSPATSRQEMKKGSRISITVEKEYSSLESWLKETEKNIAEIVKLQKDTKIIKKKLKVGNEVGYKIGFIEMNSKKGLAFLGVFHNGNLIEFEQSSPIECQNLECPTFKQMLSTIKFFKGEKISQSVKNPAKDLRVKVDMNQLMAAAEIFYDENGSYLNLAADPDVRKIVNEIQNTIGRTPGIITSNNRYCADVVLSDGKTRYCVDSEGRRGENLGCSTTKLICISY